MTAPPAEEDATPPRTLHFGLRVADANRSIAFYRKLDHEVVGSVPGTSFGELTMLKLPGDDFVTLELVAKTGTGSSPAGGNLHHFVIRVASMRDTLAALGARGVSAGPAASPDGSGETLTAWATDPDGNRIELVQWPPGHADGMTAADFAVRRQHLITARRCRAGDLGDASGLVTPARLDRGPRACACSRRPSMLGEPLASEWARGAEDRRASAHVTEGTQGAGHERGLT